MGSKGPKRAHNGFKGRGAHDVSCLMVAILVVIFGDWIKNNASDLRQITAPAGLSFTGKGNLRGI